MSEENGSNQKWYHRFRKELRIAMVVAGAVIFAYSLREDAYVHANEVAEDEANEAYGKVAIQIKSVLEKMEAQEESARAFRELLRSDIESYAEQSRNDRIKLEEDIKDLIKIAHGTAASLSILSSKHSTLEEPLDLSLPTTPDTLSLHSTQAFIKNTISLSRK